MLDRKICRDCRVAVWGNPYNHAILLDKWACPIRDSPFPDRSAVHLNESPPKGCHRIMEQAIAETLNAV